MTGAGIDGAATNGQPYDRQGYFVGAPTASTASTVSTASTAPPAANTEPIDWKRVYRTTRVRATPTSVGFLGRMLFVLPAWAYSAKLVLEPLSGGYRAFGYSYDGIIIGISGLWTKAVFAKSRRE